jgi:hypothetical protein
VSKERERRLMLGSEGRRPGEKAGRAGATDQERLNDAHSALRALKSTQQSEAAAAAAGAAAGDAGPPRCVQLPKISIRRCLQRPGASASNTATHSAKFRLMACQHKHTRRAWQEAAWRRDKAQGKQGCREGVEMGRQDNRMAAAMHLCRQLAPCGMHTTASCRRPHPSSQSTCRCRGTRGSQLQGEARCGQETQAGSQQSRCGHLRTRSCLQQPRWNRERHCSTAGVHTHPCVCFSSSLSTPTNSTSSRASTAAAHQRQCLRG